MVLVIKNEGPPRWSRPEDFEEVEDDVWVLKDDRSTRRFYGDHQCKQCGVPIDDGEHCNRCFHYLARMKNA